MIDIGYNEKNRISLHYNGLIYILLPWKEYQVDNYPLKRIYLLADTELALCYGRASVPSLVTLMHGEPFAPHQETINQRVYLFYRYKDQ